MKKKSVILMILLLIIAVFTVTVWQTVHSEYVLEAVEVDGWLFKGGSVKMEGLNREFEYAGLDYIGSETKDVTKINVTILAHSKLFDSPALLAKSSVGEKETFKLDKTFKYGAGSGKTHAINTYKSYVLDSIDLEIELENGEEVDRVVMAVPVRVIK